MVYWAIVGSNEQFTLTVQCGPFSSTVSEGAFTVPFTATQYQNKNIGATFKLPAFLATLVACPV